MKKHLLYNRPLDITQNDVIHVSDLPTIIAWSEDIKEQIEQLPDTGRGIEKKREVLETFRLALKEKTSVYRILELIELKRQGIYEPETHLGCIFQTVAAECLIK